MTIQDEIIKIASRGGKIRTSDIFARLSKKVTRQYISVVLHRLASNGKLVKMGSTRYAFYVLPEQAQRFGVGIKKRLRNKELREHEVWADIKDQIPSISQARENVRSVFEYAFSEMLNNAIEHSHSRFIEVEMRKERNLLVFTVNDSGLGAFRSVMQKRNLRSELEAIQDILKGKMTTQPQAHSGEGIFFTSKVGDIFILESFGHRLRVDNIVHDVFIEALKPVKRGTKITFSVSLDSSKHLSDVFKKYQSDPKEYAFDKTEVQVRLYTMGTIYISRSQARRILAGLEKFKTVILDFDKVPTIGQSFADEIFRVFQSRHPHITITPINMNEAIQFMVGRVEKPQQTSKGLK
mgnify:FL=1